VKRIRTFETFNTDLEIISDKIVDDIHTTCQENNIEFVLSNTDKVDAGDNYLCNGYFDDDGKSLTVAIKKDIKEWLPILMHESCHMEQYIQQTKSWTDYIDNDFDMWAWLDGKEYNESEINTGVDICKNMELECERKTIQKMKKYGLENFFNFEEVIQKTNSYILFYNYIKKYRKWYKEGPYNIKEIWKNMPKTMDINYDDLNDILAASYLKCV